MRVVGTAGHVDHGKSTLVRALTGTDPDRLAEERRRGLTIDLGFAWTRLPSGTEVSFVDVPGHVRFVKTMVAGAGAVDACLFVVDATEGWKPQTEEHLRILELLGVGHGVVALTKADLAGVEGCDRRRRELGPRLEGTFLEGAPVVALDSVSGRGVDAVVAALDAMVAAMPAPADNGRPRLWIDRAFVARGAGTVVTGTLEGGGLAVGAELAVVPGRGPDHRPTPVRVRGLESHGRRLADAGPGRRVAVNVTGAAPSALGRGQALVRADQWAPAAVVDAELTVLAGLDHEVTRRGAYHLHVGSGSHRARLRVLGGAESLGPGTTGTVRLRMPMALPLLPGDRFVLRELGRGETVGGGEVLEVAPVLPAARARPDRSVDRVVRERGWVRAEELERLTGVRRPADVGPWVVDPDALGAARRRLARALAEAGPLGLELAALGEHDQALARQVPDLAVAGGRVRAAGAADALEDHPVLRALEAEPFTPPDPRTIGIAPAELRELGRRGLVVACGDVWFAAGAVARAVEVVGGLLARHPGGITVSQVREALGSTRRYVLPLLAHLDATGWTRRRGDHRVAGGRLERLSTDTGQTKAPLAGAGT